MNKQERALKETELTEMEESFFKNNTSITATNPDKDKWQVEKNSRSIYF